MDKKEAILNMMAGKKVTHHYFSKDEWMTIRGGNIITEEGYTHPYNEFWSYRTGQCWEDGYSLFD